MPIHCNINENGQQSPFVLGIDCNNCVQQQQPQKTSNNNNNNNNKSKKQYFMIQNELNGNTAAGISGLISNSNSYNYNYMNYHQNSNNNSSNSSLSSVSLSPVPKKNLNLQYSSTMPPLIGNNSHSHHLSNVKIKSSSMHPTSSSSATSSSSSSSLMMAINRFKNSVKDMKETVLIPTRLNDLNSVDVSTNTDIQVATPAPTSALVSSSTKSSSFHNNGYINGLDEISEEDYIDSGESNGESSSLSSSCSSSPSMMANDVSIDSSTSSSSSTTSVISSKQQQQLQHQQQSKSRTVSQHPNLYEQFKLLEIIDKILSSDSVLSIQQPMARTNQGFIIENIDRNNNPRRNPRIFRMELENNHNKMLILDEEQQLHSEQSQQHRSHNNRSIFTRQSSLNNGNSNSNVNGYASCRSNSPDSGTFCIDPTDHRLQNGEQQNLVSDCSLLKIKEKLEYHLISLKSILNMMSDGAEYITRTYLEDIHSGENRFDNIRPSSNDLNETTISTRHYYTSN